MLARVNVAADFFEVVQADEPRHVTRRRFDPPPHLRDRRRIQLERHHRVANQRDVDRRHGVCVFGHDGADSHVASGWRDDVHNGRRVSNLGEKQQSAKRQGADCSRKYQRISSPVIEA